MWDIIIGIAIIIFSIYGFKEYFFYKNEPANPEDPSDGVLTSRIGFGSLLLIIIGIAFILRGLGLLDGGGF